MDMPIDVRKLLDKAAQLAVIATDWNLDEVEINGEMVSTYALQVEFEDALAAQPQPAEWQPVADGRIDVTGIEWIWTDGATLSLECLADYARVELPDDLRLCRRVTPTPPAAE